MDIALLQAAIKDAGFDGWLFYDHHHRDPIAYRILNLDEKSFVSRRWFYFVPAQGSPRKLVHRIESGKLDTLPGTRAEYSSWQELEIQLEAMLAGAKTIAMQYSPRNAIMYVSMVDAGTVEVLREMGKQIVSSANLVTEFEAVLSESQIETHFEAQRRLDGVLNAAWKRIGEAVRGGSGTSEWDIVQFLIESITREGMWTDHGPNCSVGANSADSHYEPTAATSRPIAQGDFVLIDVWAKLADPADATRGRADAVWYDITWTGVVGREPSPREHDIFTAVRDARDAAVAKVKKAYEEDRVIAGWEADDAAREHLSGLGLADWFTHRTGHNIGTELHGSGAHLDNLETHDERLLLPNTCFSVEPGLYFPGEFGIRSEVDMITRPGKAIVSGPSQRELVRI